MLVEGNLELTEAERIEIGRRTSEVNSIIKSASRLFSSVEILQEQVTEKSVALKSYWLFNC